MQHERGTCERGVRCHAEPPAYTSIAKSGASVTNVPGREPVVLAVEDRARDLARLALGDADVEGALGQPQRRRHDPLVLRG